jgi:Fic family protein
MYKPEYTITDEILNMISEIESLRTRVRSARLLPDRAIELHYRATVEMAHSSTSIEGNPLTLKQVDSVLKRQPPNMRGHSETEVRNYKAALDFIDKRKQTKKEIGFSDYLKLHKLVMKGLMPEKKTGALRAGNIYIVDFDENLRYTGPAARAVKKKLDDLLIWLSENQNVHPCIAAAIIHYQFVTIHPFADGNGRVARLLTMLYLGLRDYDLDGSIVLDTFYAQARSEYYDALHECQGEKYLEGQDLTSWIKYFASGFLSSAKVLWAEVAILSVFEPLVSKDRISRDEMEILNYAMQFGSISLSEAGEILPALSRRTLQRKLKMLSENGFLFAKGAARNTRYHWSEF